MTDAVQLPQINVTVPTPTPLAGTQGLTPQDYSRIAHFPFPNRAVVIINGVPYWEWTSVQVEVEANGNPISKFRLTTSEQVPL
ncbi:MAG: hypothetical protein J2P55_04285, partial [Rhizobiales bacterium]|nr:hypothetical protein [Hyphomicrobiales bacterium]